MTTIGPLAFGAPWVLFGLIALPIIWWLLRVTPPAAKRVRFPAVRLLLGIPQSEETPAHTPLWLLLLRLAIAALVILALSDPYLNPQSAGLKRSAVVIVVDNGWAASARWDDRVGAMQTLAAEAERDGRPLVVVPTAMSDAPAELKLLAGAEAQGAVKSIAPQPFGVDRAKALGALKRMGLQDDPDIVWLTDGLEHGDAADFARGLDEIGTLRVQTDDSLNAALALAPPIAEGSAMVFRVVRGKNEGEVKGTLRATGTQGRFLASQDFALAAGKNDVTVKFDLATELRNDLARVEIADRGSAGSVVLIDERWRRRPVGLISGQTVDTAQPLLSDLFYLERSLTPYAELHQGKVGDLIRAGLSVLVLADVGQMVADDKTAVAQWIARGGVLIRFAGPKLAAQSDELIPGKLRTGGRLLGSAMAWTEPQKLSPDWPEDSPFAGLAVPPDVSVTRQVLTEPDTEGDVRTWAQLGDGTPLVTATRREKGWIVLFHVTANTAWSSLPISGLFVEMLRRTVALSSGVAGEATAASAGPLAPVETLDGFGRLGAPAASALPMRAADFDAAPPGPQHPPGFYGEGGIRRAFNLFKHDMVLKPLPPLPAGVELATFGLREALELKYVMMALAIALALIDLVAGLILRGLIAVPRLPVRAATAAIVAAALFAPSLAAIGDARAADEAFAMKAALSYRLAYVQTGDPEVDAMSRAGLKGLTRVLKERTAVEPGEPMAVDIETDEIAFFPLLYWPVTNGQAQLSARALEKVDTFMRNGGTIVFDTRDQDTALPISTGRTQSGSQVLRRMLAGLDIPPLQPLNQDHVLSRSFYLLREYPGRWASGKVWLEAQAAATDGQPAATTASDGVSPIIVGGADWAAAWAEDDEGRPIAAVVPGGERQREMAMRFGVNIVMYTLTGNYKTDQVHVEHILERLGQ